MYNVSTILTPEQKMAVKGFLCDTSSVDHEENEGQPQVNGSSSSSPEDDQTLVIGRAEWDAVNQELKRVQGLLGIGVDKKLVGGSEVDRKALFIFAGA